MAFWKIINNRHYESIGKFVGITALVCLILPAFYIVDKSLDSLVDVKHLFSDNSNCFITFLIAYFFILITTLHIYSKTLGTYEAETSDTPKAAMKNISIWIFFWIAWSVFCSYLTITQRPWTTLVFITILVLTILPGFISFLLSTYIRTKNIKSENLDRQRMGDEYEPYTICLDKKYYSGYYGLICLPVYLISLLVGQIF